MNATIINPLLHGLRQIFRRGWLLAVWGLLLVSGNAAAQAKDQLVRLAKLEIHPAQLASYKAALKEEIETSLRVEPGVITLYAVAEKDNPNRITILEIYASQAAYKLHIQTPHFLKYKVGTKEMVKSLELIETVPVVPSAQVKQ
ncbi:putative quinol monooxygenase [Hymenobacter norwichensis]|uniref:putative quinol monooxygenase n=1 Tax=Hymenobacter norwichensis TaxID=223903 RepID=UPI0003B708BB|nr:putative quinol monooxygenase [Hymenobacter norwichensis]